MEPKGTLDNLFDLAEGLADNLTQALGTPHRWCWMQGPWVSAPAPEALVHWDPRRLVAHVVVDDHTLCPEGPPVDFLRPVEGWAGPAAVVCTGCLAALEAGQ